jgi:hypothetical protein
MVRHIFSTFHFPPGPQMRFFARAEKTVPDDALSFMELAVNDGEPKCLYWNRLAKLAVAS